MNIKVGDFLKLACDYESASGWIFHQGAVFKIKSTLLTNWIEDYPCELMHDISNAATIVISVSQRDLQNYFMLFTPEKHLATIVVNGPHNELGKLGSAGLDELAKLCKIKPVKDNEVGILFRGRSGKLYSIGSLLHGLLKGKKK